MIGRRLGWFATGAACGFAGAVYSYARLRSSRVRLQPEQVADAFVAITDEASGRLRDFVADARIATRDVEAELWARRDHLGGGVEGPVDAASVASPPTRSRRARSTR